MAASARTFRLHITLEVKAAGRIATHSPLESDWTPKTYTTSRYATISALSRYAECAVLMPKMPRAGEHHGDVMIVGGLDHLVVAYRAAGLNDRGGAGFDSDQKSVGERKESV
jgi:hypothetical protein